MKTIELTLSHDERTIVAHAIIWVLGCPFERTFPPLLSLAERADLERLLKGLDPKRHNFGSVVISIGGRFAIRTGQLRLPKRMAELMMKAIGSFYGEKLHTTWEYEVVTSLPWETAQPLVSRMQAFVLSLPVPSFEAIRALDLRHPFRDTSMDHADDGGD